MTATLRLVLGSLADLICWLMPHDSLRPQAEEAIDDLFWLAVTRTRGHGAQRTYPP